MDIIIVDDEPLARRRLSRMVSALGFDVVAEADNSASAYQAVLIHDPAVLLLDIDMPGENGLQLAKRIGALDEPPAIVFTTAYDQFAVDAFETLAAGYLLKPVQSQQLQKALEKAQLTNKLQRDVLLQTKPPESKHEYINAKTHRGVELIPIEDIRCFLADQKYVSIITTQGNILIDRTLKELEQSFSQRFIRVHRNALVSLKHIQGLDRDNKGHYTVRLSDTEEKPAVSRRYTNKLKDFLVHL